MPVGKVFQHFFGRSNGDEVVEDWSLKLRSEVSRGGVKAVRDPAKNIYRDEQGLSLGPDDVAYLLGASAARVEDESYVDGAEIMEHVEGVVPALYSGKVDEGFSDYKDGSLRF